MRLYSRCLLALIVIRPAEQEYVLEMSSLINSLSVPLWNNLHTVSVVPCLQQTHALIHVHFSNTGDQPLLPASATEMNATWRKPRDMYPEVTYASQALQPDDIVQNITSDCSVCTSVSVCLQHHRLLGSKVHHSTTDIGYAHAFHCTQLLLSSMHPQNAEGFPEASLDGVYSLRLYVNGAYRKVAHLTPRS